MFRELSLRSFLVALLGAGCGLMTPKDSSVFDKNVSLSCLGPARPPDGGVCIDSVEACPLPDGWILCSVSGGDQ